MTRIAEARGTPDSLKIRLNSALRAKLEKAAELDETSLNREIAARLERSFDRWASLNVDDIAMQITTVVGWLADHQRNLLERDLRETTVRDTSIREVTFCISTLVSTLKSLAPHTTAPQKGEAE